MDERSGHPARRTRPSAAACGGERGRVVPGLSHDGQYVLIRLVLGYLEEGHYLPAAAALPACGNALSVAGTARLAVIAGGLAQYCVLDVVQVVEAVPEKLLEQVLVSILHHSALFRELMDRSSEFTSNLTAPR